MRELAKQHRVRTIVNLQQDKDMQYWNVDFGANQHACRELGINLVRRPVSDPRAAAKAAAIRHPLTCSSRGSVVCVHYLHCQLQTTSSCPCMPCAWAQVTWYVCVWHIRLRVVGGLTMVLPSPPPSCRPATLTPTACAT